MDVIEAIRTRRTIAKFRPEPVAVETLLRLLEAGIWAPNHHLTEPWRFVILGPETQRRLAERFAALRQDKLPPDAADHRARVGDETRRTFLAVPAIVAVAVVRDEKEQRRREDYAATCCAIQNIQLAAWAEGIGVKWSTSVVTRDALAYEVLDLDAAQCDIVAFLYIGYPAEVSTGQRRRPLAEIVRHAP